MARTTRLSRTVGLVGLAAAFAGTAAVAQTPAGLLNLLAGEYNNNEQVWQQGIDATAAVARVHWRFEPLSEGRMGVSRGLGQSAPVDPAWEFRFDGTVAVVAAIGSAQTACSYRWHERPGGFTGVVAAKPECPAELPATWELTPEYLVAAYANATGEIVHRARRVSPYTGWIAFSRGHIDPALASDDFILMRDLALHDEGFRISIVDGGRPTGYAVELVRLTYQNTRTAVLKLGIVDQSSGETVSYSWAEPGAARIGINLRWVQAGMTRLP